MHCYFAEKCLTAVQDINHLIYRSILDFISGWSLSGTGDIHGKAHVAAGGPFCAVRRRPQFLGPFLHSFVRRRPNFKNWISVGDRITGSPGFIHV